MSVEGDIILWAAVLGLLVGIIWSMRYIVKMQRELHDMHQQVSNISAKKKGR